MSEPRSDNLQMKVIYPHVPPYNQVTNYLVSKRELGSRQWKCYEWDKARNCTEIDLYEARNVSAVVETNLAEKRSLLPEKIEKLDKQWSQLEDGQLRLRRSFIKLSTFVRSNQEKRERAIVKIKEERKVREERQKDVKELREKLKVMDETKERMDKEMTTHKLFEKFLDEVVDASEDFKHQDDILNRYESLILTRRQLSERQLISFQALETAKANIAKMCEDNAFYILGLNNVLSSLNSRYKNAVSKALHWENNVLAIRKNALKKFSELNEARQSIWNLYRLMCEHKKQAPRINEAAIEEQLLFIKHSLQSSEKIIQQMTVKMRKKDSISRKGSKGTS